MQPSSFKFEQTRKRIIAKTMLYRIICIVALTCVIYIVTGNLIQVTTVVVIYQVFQTLIFYFHEKIWEGTEWGIIRRRHAKPQRFNSTVRSVFRTGRKVSGVFNKIWFSIRDFIDEHNLFFPSDVSQALDEIEHELHKTMRLIYGGDAKSCPVCKKLLNGYTQFCTQCTAKSKSGITLYKQRKIQWIQKQTKHLLQSVHRW